MRHLNPCPVALGIRRRTILRDPRECEVEDDDGNQEARDEPAAHEPDSLGSLNGFDSLSWDQTMPAAVSDGEECHSPTEDPNSDRVPVPGTATSTSSLRVETLPLCAAGRRGSLSIVTPTGTPIFEEVASMYHPFADECDFAIAALFTKHKTTKGFANGFARPLFFNISITTGRHAWKGVGSILGSLFRVSKAIKTGMIPNCCLAPFLA
ncbi:hypothetical protein MMC07_003570 [Pseudocyphellaria aurata]|nr:hypothetical protein [Pseudocyphellaria aurata]